MSGWMKLAVFALLAPASSCLDVASERIGYDLEVGQAAIGGDGRVSVVDGLASVRRVSPGELVLWGQAPAFEVDVLTPAGSPATWTLTVRNALPDLQLTAPGLAVETLPGTLPTVRSFRLSLPAGATTRLRLAPPDADQPGRYRFGVLSDVQEAIDRVGDVHRKINATPDVRFVLGIGDLTQRGGRDEMERFQSELEALEVPYFATLGNHELGANPPVYYELVGRGNSHFVYRGVHYSLLDSASATIDPEAYEWLDGWLEQGRDSVHIFGMHIPPLDPVGSRNGAFGSRAEAAKLLTRLADGHVDLTLYGHIHTYFPYSNGGIPAYISGGGGAIPERLDGIGRHFLVIDVDPVVGIEQVGVVRVD
ncbi:MAG: metallophosphoesterase [Myxococcales bacterium]|nr:MAG: metallophosphoesterase [Myxococcales bacterium]